MASSKQYAFGAGEMVGKTKDGKSIRFGTLQGIELDFTASQKELFGEFRFAEAVAGGTMKVSGKAEIANIQASIFAELFLGVSTSTGSTQIKSREVAVVPSTPFEVTVVKSADFVADLGVTDSDGNPLLRVASAPTTGQYSVNEATGVYTFAAADVALSVRISYSYTEVEGTSVIMTNQLMGNNPVFEVHLSAGFNGKKVYIKLNQCSATKWTFATKLEDFAIPQFEFSCFVNDAGELGEFSNSISQ